jgi:hypothetical protein
LDPAEGVLAIQIFVAVESPIQHQRPSSFCTESCVEKTFWIERITVFTGFIITVFGS